MHGHTVIYGDGTVFSRKRCMFPAILMECSTNQSSKSQLHELNHNNNCCPNGRQSGNSEYIGFLSCIMHTSALCNLGLPPEKVNDYLIYMSMVSKIQKLNNEKQTKLNDEKRQKLEQSMNTLFNENDKKLYVIYALNSIELNN